MARRQYPLKMHPSITALHQSSDWTTFAVPFVIRPRAEKTSKRASCKLKDDGFVLSHFIARSYLRVDVSYASSDGPEPSLAEKPTAPSSIPMAADLGDEFDDVIVTNAMSCTAKSASGSKLYGLKLPFLDREAEEVPTFT
jgi:hypothetical protein